jgi:hypothetical protein
VILLRSVCGVFGMHNMVANASGVTFNPISIK